MFSILAAIYSVAVTHEALSVVAASITFPLQRLRSRLNQIIYIAEYKYVICPTRNCVVRFTPVVIWKGFE